MKTKLIVIGIFTITMLSIHCKKEQDDTPQTVSFDLLTEQGIGSQGGTITAEGVMTVEVPPGAFSSTLQMQIYSSTDISGFEEDAASEVVYLKGLPGQLLKPLRIAIKHDGTATTGTYISQGELSQRTTVFDTIFGSRLLSAHDSSGYLVAFIEPYTGKIKSTLAGNPGEGPHGAPYSCVKHFSFRESDHFIIYHSTQDFNTPELQALNDGLEGAYTLLDQWGFEVNRLTKRVKVTLKYLNQEIYGQSLHSFPLTDNSGYIEINRINFHDQEISKITGAHEFFHLVQDLYSLSDKYNWLQEASSTWFEQFFSADPQHYVPQMFSANAQQPYKGLQAGLSGGSGPHGYGCASVIKYLMEINNASHSPSAIRQIWEGTKSGNLPPGILLDFQTVTPDWWNHFVYAHFTDMIYSGITQSYNRLYFNTATSRLFRVRQASDTAISFTNQGMDLSGEVYFIDIDKADLTALSKCTIGLTGGMSHLYIFKSKPNGIELIDDIDSDEETSFGNLKAFYDKGEDIVLLLSNYAAHPDSPLDYEGVYPTHINVKIKEEGASTNYYQSLIATLSTEHYTAELQLTISCNEGFFFSVVADSVAEWNQYNSTKMVTITFPAISSGKTIQMSIHAEITEIQSGFEGIPEIIEAPFVRQDKDGYQNLDLGIMGSYDFTASFDSQVGGGYTNLDLKLKTSHPSSVQETISVLGISYNPLK
jgi:hypothetical protein